LDTHRRSGCSCPHCFSLAEYMADLTGKDYGLSPAPGHALKLVQPKSEPMTGISPDELRKRREAIQTRKALPWEEDYAA
jgi:hypothetical protein